MQGLYVDRGLCNFIFILFYFGKFRVGFGGEGKREREGEGNYGYEDLRGYDEFLFCVSVCCVCVCVCVCVFPPVWVFVCTGFGGCVVL